MAEKKKSGGSKKHGRNKDKCKAYAVGLRRYKHKVKRVLRSSGENAAADYARKHYGHAKRYARNVKRG